MENRINLISGKDKNSDISKQLDLYLEYPELRSGILQAEPKTRYKKQVQSRLNPGNSPVNNVNARWFRRLINLWPPYWGTGICVSRISPDFKRITVTMKMRWYNKNAVGKHFGGSLFSMTDPFHMLMLMKNLGEGYRVLDKAGGIEFLKPGIGTVTAEFLLTVDTLDQIRKKTASGDKYFRDFTVTIRDERGEAVARVTKTVYVKKIINGYGIKG